MAPKTVCQRRRKPSKAVRSAAMPPTTPRSAPAQNPRPFPASTTARHCRVAVGGGEVLLEEVEALEVEGVQFVGTVAA